MDESLIAHGWKGLNRKTAPHLIEATESPDTVDAAPAGGVLGKLGPRRGRKRVLISDYKLLGILNVHLPWNGGQRYRVTCGDNGIWSADPVPQPGLGETGGGEPTPGTGNNSAPPTVGFDILRIEGLSASQNGEGTTYSDEYTVSPPMNLSNYGPILPHARDGTPYLEVTASGISQGFVGVEGYIAGEWVLLCWVSVIQNATVIRIELGPLVNSGLLTKVRAQANISLTNGGGTMSSTWDLDLYFLRAPVATDIIVAEAPAP